MADEEARDEVVAALREQASELVQQIDGPLRKVSVSAGDSAITVEWAEGADGAEPAARPAEEDNGGAAGSNGHGETGGVMVTAPLVGTFYRAPEPGADPFVEVGTAVEADQMIGIVEAMKLMNPIKAAQPGTVTAIHAENGQMVEFDQPLVELSAEPAE